MLELFLRSQANVHKIGMEPAETEYKDAEHDGDEGSDKADPVAFHRFSKSLTTTHTFIFRVVFNIFDMQDHICKAQKSEDKDRQGHMGDEDIKKTIDR